jgi:hypothetical protein
MEYMVLHMTRNPITLAKLKLKSYTGKNWIGNACSHGGFRPVYLITNWIKVTLGYFYFKTKKGKVLPAHTWLICRITLIIDGRITTVISGTTTTAGTAGSSIKQN